MGRLWLELIESSQTVGKGSLFLDMKPLPCFVRLNQLLCAESEWHCCPALSKARGPRDGIRASMIPVDGVSLLAIIKPFYFLANTSEVL